MRQFWGINFHAHVMALSPAWPSSGGHPHQDSLLSSAKPSVTGSSFLLGHSEPFWICQWVDDIVLIEIDVGDRLQKAEKRIKDGVKLVFGSDGWHEGKFTTWSRVFHAVGIDWNIPDGCITVPHRKIDKVHSMLADTLGKAFISRKRLDSLIGVLWHVISFTPITKPFIQCLTLVQNQCREHNKPGVPMTSFLRKEMTWWNELVFQNEFVGLPMELFEKDTGHGRTVGPEVPGAVSVEIVYNSHKGDRMAQGVIISHYKTDNAALCPVLGARTCLQIRTQWLAKGRTLGPYLTVSRTTTIKKSQVSHLIKAAAASLGRPRKDYLTHSLRIGGACALLAVGNGDLVIRLMGRWSSWCFTVYTRLRPGMIRDAASWMIKASTWECHELGIIPSQISCLLGGELQRV
ncbi:hypothetical protein PC117_g25382 [Phytophthora cactorum]|uniref:Tyr recombinase domain-containing protein n=1 Tax=Phytophthora cactorum TaxID=29920 RepID=A0A8T1AQ16_9STRA|nr:hypothetical protein PC117_g25382 [Phytophthora cactorum]